MFATTVNALTIGYLPEIAYGVYALREEYESDDMWNWASGSLVWGPGNQYAITSIPLDIRDKYMDDYYKFGNFMDKEFTEWEKLYNYLKEMPFDEKLHNEMMRDIQLRDKHRGTCLTDVFPEWEPYYEKL